MNRPTRRTQRAQSTRNSHHLIDASTTILMSLSNEADASRHHSRPATASPRPRTDLSTHPHQAPAKPPSPIFPGHEGCTGNPRPPGRAAQASQPSRSHPARRVTQLKTSAQPRPRAQNTTYTLRTVSCSSQGPRQPRGKTATSPGPSVAGFPPSGVTVSVPDST